MVPFLLNIFLAIAWMLLSGELDFVNFIQGLVIGFVVLYITRHALQSQDYFSRVPKIISFVLYFLYELVKANIIVTYDILTIRHKMRPGIIALPLDAKSDFEITILANFITLTPGTLSLDTSDDKKILFVHAMYIEDVEDFKKEIKNGIEKKLLELTR